MIYDVICAIENALSCSTVFFVFECFRSICQKRKPENMCACVLIFGVLGSLEECGLVLCCLFLFPFFYCSLSSAFGCVNLRVLQIQMRCHFFIALFFCVCLCTAAALLRLADARTPSVARVGCFQIHRRQFRIFTIKFVRPFISNWIWCVCVCVWGGGDSVAFLLAKEKGPRSGTPCALQQISINEAATIELEQRKSKPVASARDGAGSALEMES